MPSSFISLFYVCIGCIKDILKIFTGFDEYLYQTLDLIILRLNYCMLLNAITLHITAILLHVVTCHYISLDFYYDMFVAFTNPSSSTRMAELLVPLTDSIRVEAAHQPQFPCPKVSRKTG